MCTKHVQGFSSFYIEEMGKLYRSDMQVYFVRYCELWGRVKNLCSVLARDAIQLDIGTDSTCPICLEAVQGGLDSIQMPCCKNGIHMRCALDVCFTNQHGRCCMCRKSTMNMSSQLDAVRGRLWVILRMVDEAVFLVNDCFSRCVR